MDLKCVLGFLKIIGMVIFGDFEYLILYFRYKLRDFYGFFISLNHVMKTAGKEKKSPKFRTDGWNFLETNTDEVRL